MKYLTRFLRNWRNFIIILPLALLGPVIRWIPVTSKYPIGGDSGQYFSQAAAYATTWPLFPETLPIMGNVPVGSETLPLLPWLMAMLNRLFNLDLYTVTIITPLLICAFGSISIYLLARQITGRQHTGLIAALFYATSKFNLWCAYPAYNARSEFGTVAIMLFFFFILKIVPKVNKNGMYKSYDFWRDTFFAGLSLFGIIASHDYAIIAVFIIGLAFAIVAFIFERKRFLKSTLPAILSGGLTGILLSIPVIILWWDFFTERFIRVGTRLLPIAAETREQVFSSFLSGLPSFHYGHLVILFALLGLLLILLRVVRKDGRTPGIYLLLGWTIPVYITTKLYLIDVYFFDLPRMMTYMVVPLSIFAAIGLLEAIVWIERVIRSFNRHCLRIITVSCIVGLVVVVQVHEAASMAELTKTTRPAHPYINEQIEQGILWLKDNTAEDSIVFVPALAPYVANEYISGISGRAYILTVHPGVEPSGAREYQMNVEAHHVIGQEDLEVTFEILGKYSQEYSEGYVLIGKKQINYANAYGENIDLKRLDSYYQQVFENREIAIYQAYPLE